MMDVRTGSEIFEKDVARELCSLISDDYNVMCGDAGGDLAVFSLESGAFLVCCNVCSLIRSFQANWYIRFPNTKAMLARCALSMTAW